MSRVLYLTSTAVTPYITYMAQPPKEPCDRKRVLVVDDDEEIREVFSLVLSEEFPECQIETAVNGADGFELFQQNRHAVIIMDLHMPVMDGEEAFQEIHELCSEDHIDMPSVLFCTAYNPPQGVQHIVTGSDKHELLRKPVANEVLTSAVRCRLQS